MSPITAGSRVRIIAVNHHNFNEDIGTTATVIRLVADGTMAWCRPDKLFPKKTRKGVEMVPAHWEILRHVHTLELAHGQ